jgi:hypothetical protein
VNFIQVIKGIYLSLLIPPYQSQHHRTDRLQQCLLQQRTWQLLSQEPLLEKKIKLAKKKIFGEKFIVGKLTLFFVFSRSFN